MIPTGIDPTNHLNNVVQATVESVIDESQAQSAWGKLVSRFTGLFSRAAAAPDSVSIDDAVSVDNAYAGANVTRNNNHWVPSHFSGNTAISGSWDTLTARCRDLCRNDPLFQKVLAQLTSLIVADGLKPYARAVDASGGDIDDYNRESDTWFRRWADNEADADGEKSLWEMQRLSFADTAQVGCSLMMRVFNRSRDRISPLSYKLIEWEQLARDYDTARGSQIQRLAPGNRISNGIEYNRAGKAVAFWIYFDHPYDSTMYFSYKPTRISADRIIHNYLPSRISDTTGVSWFASMVQPAKDRDQLLGNTLTATAVQALMTLVVQRNASTGGSNCASLDEVDPETGKTQVGMGYPFIAEVDRNDKVEVAESRKNLPGLQTFVDMIWNLESMGARLSLNRVLGDPSKANMASLRAAFQDDDALMSPIRQHQARRLAIRVRSEWTRLAIADGTLQSVTAEQFNNAPWRYLQFEVIGAHRGDVNPKEDVDANIDLMRSGQETYQDVCAARGHNWREQIDKIAAVNAYTQEQGVALDWSKGQGALTGVTTTDSDLADAVGGDSDEQTTEEPADVGS